MRACVPGRGTGRRRCVAPERERDCDPESVCDGKGPVGCAMLIRACSCPPDGCGHPGPSGCSSGRSSAGARTPARVATIRSARWYPDTACPDALRRLQARTRDRVHSVRVHIPIRPQKSCGLSQRASTSALVQGTKGGEALPSWLKGGTASAPRVSAGTKQPSSRVPSVSCRLRLTWLPHARGLWLWQLRRQAAASLPRRACAILACGVRRAGE